MDTADSKGSDNMSNAEHVGTILAHPVEIGRILKGTGNKRRRRVADVGSNECVGKHPY